MEKTCENEITAARDPHASHICFFQNGELVATLADADADFIFCDEQDSFLSALDAIGITDTEHLRTETAMRKHFNDCGLTIDFARSLA